MNAALSNTLGALILGLSANVTGPPLLNFSVQPIDGSHVQITWTGQKYRCYRVEGSSNMVQWVERGHIGYSLTSVTMPAAGGPASAQVTCYLKSVLPGSVDALMLTPTNIVPESASYSFTDSPPSAERYFYRVREEALP